MYNNIEIGENEPEGTLRHGVCCECRLNISVMCYPEMKQRKKSEW
jgi:hypothetical protein